MSELLKFLLAAALAVSCAGQITNSLLTEFDKLKIHTALVAPSSGVDESPLWSPDSRLLGVNVRGKWFQVDTVKVELQAATWHSQRIGRVSSGGAISPLDEAQLGAWRKATRSDSTALVDDAGNKYEFVRKALRTSFVVIPKGRKPLSLWTSGLENCGELSLSPNGRWLAFICEENGVLVTNVDRVLGGR